MSTIPALPMVLMPVKLMDMMNAHKITPEMKFSDAASVWLSSLVSRSENTEASYSNYVKSLNLFFGETKLEDIRLDHLTVYQKLRVNGEAPFIRYRRPQDATNGKGKTPCPAKAKKVNQELNALTRVLRRAGLWTDQHAELYEPLPEEIAEIQRALTPEEQRRWLETAMIHPRWQVIFWYSLLAFDTCMSTNEIRALRLMDINLPLRTVKIGREGAKNKYRARTIIIGSPEAMSALQCLLERAAKLGAREPHHHLFPLRSTPGQRADSAIYDPTKPMTESGLKKPWGEVRDASKLAWFRMYDTRHTAITRLAESGVPIPYIMKRAGHISQAITEHYTHLSEAFMMKEMERSRQVYMSQAYGLKAPLPQPQEFGIQQPPMPYNMGWSFHR